MAVGRPYPGVYIFDFFYLGILYHYKSKELERDLREREELEKSLKASEEKYSTIVEKGNDGIIIVQYGLLRFVNQKMVEMAGYTIEEVIGNPFLEHISDKHRRLVL